MGTPRPLRSPRLSFLPIVANRMLRNISYIKGLNCEAASANTVNERT